MKNKSKVSTFMLAILFIVPCMFMLVANIARYKNPLEPKEAVRSWLRRKDTIEYLGLWEQL